MLVWRVVNNMDSNRDVYIEDNTICIDGTNKNDFDNFKRRWLMMLMLKEVIKV